MTSFLAGKENALRFHPSYQRPMRLVMGTVALLALLMLLSWASPTMPATKGIASYLPLHTLLETIAITIAVLVFAVGWNANVGKLSGNVMLLACAFLGVGLLDFSHVLSYPGMPDFVTSSGTSKAINFWLAARALAAVALLVVAVTPWRPLASATTRYVLLSTVLVLVSVLYWLFLFQSDRLPQTFIPGKGLTTFKVGSEYAIITLNIVAALALWLRMRKPQPFNAPALLGAVCTMALSEFFFTLYADVTDIFNLLGHIYKVISYLFIYRAIFVDAVEEPYLRLNESQNQLQSTLKALPDLLFEVGLDGRYLDYRSPHEVSATRPDKDLIGESLSATLPSDSVQSLMTALNQAHQTGRSNGTYSIEEPQGKRWMAFSVARKPVDAGQAPRFIVLSQDVTENRRIEETNIRLFERLELATSSAHIGIWDWDVVNNVLLWDERMFGLYKLNKESYGGTYEAWRSAVHPSDREYAEEAIQLALRNEKPYDIDFRVLWPGGEVHHIKAMGQVIRDAKGVPLRMLGVNYDITERKRVEAELVHHREQLETLVQERTTDLERQNLRNELILGTTLDGFFSADQQGRIRDANPAYCRMLGYSSEKLLQLTIPDVEGNENPQQVAVHIDKVIADGHDRFDTRHRHKDGSLVDVELSVSLVELGGEKFFYAFVRDITDRKLAERKLLLARDEAEGANAAKSEFLSRMSHELRTPLNAILGFGQLLETDTEKPLPQAQADNVQEILHAGHHLLELVNEVLDLSRIESGRLDISLEPVIIAPLVEQCMVQIKPLAVQRGITLAVEMKASGAVMADQMRLRQVLLNLLSNAVKYNRKGGSIRVDCVPVAEDRLRISVHDSGHGIAADALPRLFKPFERLESAYEGTEGSGIGLALAKKLVQAMHGAIGVQSTPGEGSTFWVELPVAQEKQALAEPSSAAPAGTDIAVEGERHTILYIEDNPSNLRLVQKIIATRKNIELLFATNAEDGLEIAASRHPDLILLDINLPGMNGFEALDRLRQNPVTRDIAVIAVTANAMIRDVERGKAAGFSDYIAKPLDMGLFFAAIDRQLAHGKREG